MTVGCGVPSRRWTPSLRSPTSRCRSWSAASRLVRRASDHVIEGYCIANGVDIALGSAGQLAPVVPDQVVVGCSEHDDNGGDCQVLGQILCSE